MEIFQEINQGVKIFQIRHPLAPGGVYGGILKKHFIESDMRKIRKNVSSDEKMKIPMIILIKNENPFDYSD